MTVTSSLAEGWLFKQGSIGLVSTRLARYCILTENELQYYKHKSDARPNGIIELKYYVNAEKDSGKYYPHGFRIVSQCKQRRSYIFYADNEKECQYWIDIINGGCLTSSKGLEDDYQAAVLPPMDESYSVLDKWLNRLDLNDDQPMQRKQSMTPPALVYSPATNSNASAAIATNSTIHPCHPTVSPNRMSSDSLESLPSETTLSSSAGSRAYVSMGQNVIYAPSTNNNTTISIDQQLSSKAKPSSTYNKRNSNPITFVSRSLSNLKNHHHAVKSNHQQKHTQQSPSWSLDSLTSSSSISNTNNSSTIKTPMSFPRKDWETEELFHFEHDMGPDPSKLYKNFPVNGNTRSPSLSQGV